MDFCWAEIFFHSGTRRRFKVWPFSVRCRTLVVCGRLFRITMAKDVVPHRGHLLSESALSSFLLPLRNVRLEGSLEWTHSHTLKRHLDMMLVDWVGRTGDQSAVGREKTLSHWWGEWTVRLRASSSQGSFRGVLTGWAECRPCKRSTHTHTHTNAL